jgi:hypothetical protein
MLHGKTILFAAAVLAGAAWCPRGWAQNANNATQGGGTAVNTQVGQELYGNNTPSNPPLYGPQILPLPSETRFAIERSGILPSELLINSQIAGPLPQYGALSYIPFESPLQAAMKAPPPALWGPAYGPKRSAPSAAPGPVPSAQLNRDVQYPAGLRTPQPAPSQYIAPQQPIDRAVPTGYRVTPNSGPTPQEGTTISRPIPSATRPSTRPSY